MSEIKDGGPAFPALVIEGGSDNIGKKEGVWHYTGMTLRDYFAAKALVSVMLEERHATSEQIAGWAYELADAMLKAREL